MGLDVIAREQAFDTAAIYVIAIFLVLWRGSELPASRGSTGRIPQNRKIYMHHNPIVFQWLDAFKRFANPAVQRTSGTRPFVFCVLARGIEWQRLVFLLFKWFRRTNGYSARFVLVVAARQNLFSSLG